MTVNDIAAMFPDAHIETATGEVVIYTGLVYRGDDSEELEFME